jgi:hypothetical protein
VTSNEAPDDAADEIAEDALGQGAMAEKTAQSTLPPQPPSASTTYFTYVCPHDLAAHLSPKTGERMFGKQGYRDRFEAALILRGETP